MEPQVVRCSAVQLRQLPGAIFELTLFPLDEGLFGQPMCDPIKLRLDRRSPMVGYELATQLSNNLGLYPPFLASCRKPVEIPFVAEFGDGLILPRLTVDFALIDQLKRQ